MGEGKNARGGATHTQCAEAGEGGGGALEHTREMITHLCTRTAPPRCNSSVCSSHTASLCETV